MVTREREVSIATIWRALRNERISNKRVAREALQRDEYQRALYTAEIGRFKREDIIFLDESSVDARTAQRRSGWSEIGRACTRRLTHVRGKNYSVLPVLSINGIEAIEIYDGPIDRERFLQFLYVSLVRLLVPCHVACTEARLLIAPDPSASPHCGYGQLPNTPW